MQKITLAEEKILVEKAKESLSAFSKLYEYYLPKIYSYLLNRVGDKKTAEDITSETFLKAMKKIDKFKYQGFTFGGWLYKIAHNSLCDYYKKNKAIISLDEIKNVPETKNPDILEKIDNNHQIRQVLQYLKEDYQQILALKFFENLSNPEIAEILGITVNSLNVKLHRSIEAFRKHYVNLFPKEKEVILS